MKRLLYSLSIFLLLLVSVSLKAQLPTFNQFDTQDGYIKLGPFNDSFAHIYTDMPRFIFNKTIYSYYGGFSSYSTHNLSLSTNGTKRMTIKTSNGNVGIGTINPKQKLHVNGHILLPTNYQLRLGTNNPNTGSFRIRNTSHYNTYADIDGNLYFRTIHKNGTLKDQVLAMQSDGTVLIGVKEKYDNSIVNTQGYKLMVNGGILCEELKVIADVPNSDDVFEQDYDLKPLEEVEAFIQEHKHLPEVPSAQTFKEEGYKVGEMDDLLLRKVEELTLYIIELKKEIEELKAKKE